MKRSGFKKKTYTEAVEASLRSQKNRAARKRTVKPKNAGKVAKQAKKAPPKKKRRKKTERQKLEEKLWEECKRIIRTRYPNECFTCRAVDLAGVNWQTGHGKPKGALPLQFKYDLRNLRPQCMNCNINLGGASDIFIAKLEQDQEGLTFLEEACRKTEEGWIIKKEGGLVGKEATEFLRDLLESYQQVNP